MKCDDNTLTPEHALYQWGQYYVEAGATIGKHMDETPKHPGYLAAAGFTNIKVEVKKWASNTWPANRQDREIGMWMRENIAGPGGIEGISMALFTRGKKQQWKTLFLLVLLAAAPVSKYS